MHPTHNMARTAPLVVPKHASIRWDGEELGDWPCERGFAALSTAYLPSGGLAIGDDLGRLQAEQGLGDINQPGQAVGGRRCVWLRVATHPVDPDVPV